MSIFGDIANLISDDKGDALDDIMQMLADVYPDLIAQQQASKESQLETFSNSLANAIAAANAGVNAVTSTVSAGQGKIDAAYADTLDYLKRSSAPYNLFGIQAGVGLAPFIKEDYVVPIDEYLQTDLAQNIIDTTTDNVLESAAAKGMLQSGAAEAELARETSEKLLAGYMDYNNMLGNQKKLQQSGLVDLTGLGAQSAANTGRNVASLTSAYFGPTASTTNTQASLLNQNYLQQGKFHEQSGQDISDVFSREDDDQTNLGLDWLRNWTSTRSSQGANDAALTNSLGNLVGNLLTGGGSTILGNPSGGGSWINPDDSLFWPNT